MKGRKPADRVVTAFNLGSGLVSACAALLAVVLILYSGYVLYDSMAIEVSAMSAGSDLLKYKPGVLSEPRGEDGKEEESLAAVNKDYRAWITVKDSPIDYPVVQGKDDLYYASHDVYGKVSLTGAIYLAAANGPNFTDSYNLLYGHHMDSGSMFGSLDKFQDKGYFKSHQTAVLTTNGGATYDVTFFAVATTDAYEKQIYTVGNRAEQVKKFLTGDRSRDAGIGTNVLIYDSSVAKDASKVLALSTCAGASTNGRLVVFGRMVKRGGSGGDDSVKLTVKFQDENRKKLFPDEVHIYEKGGRYYVVPPQKPGYDTDVRIVQGTINENMQIIITYTPKTWTLRIRYRKIDGTDFGFVHQQQIRTDEAYDVESPAIDGWKPVRLRISGVNPGRDEYYTVIYVPDDWTDYRDMDDYTTPLDLGDYSLQAGVCGE